MWGPFRRESIFYWLALLAILNYAVLALWYVGLDNYFSYAEPNIASVSWILMEGQPLYHTLESAGQYSMVYGPYLFFIKGLFLKLLGPSIASTKVPAALFAILSVLSIVYTVGKAVNYRYGVMAGGFLVLTYFSFWPFSTFVARADAIILGLVGLALVAVLGKNKWGSIVFATLSLGVCLGVKAHAAMYFLPIWVILFQRFGWRASLVAGLSAAVISVAPFFMAHNVSLANYILWLRVVSERGLDFTLFVGNVRNMLLIQLLPVVLALSVLPRPMEVLGRHKLFVTSVAFSLAVVVVVASAVGAGKFHLVPFSIVIVYWLATVMAKEYRAAAGETRGARAFRLKHLVIYFLLAVMLLTAFPVNRRMLRLAGPDGAFNGAVSDIEQILSAYPGKSIAMGDGQGKGYTLTYYRPLLVFAGNPYLLDSSSVMDRISVGYEFGENTLAAIRNCTVDIWLIPKSNTPFALGKFYGGTGNLYSDTFRKAFLDNHQLNAQTGYYDLWFCGKG